MDNLQVQATKVITVTGATGPAGPAGPQGATGAAGSADAWSRTGNSGTTAGTNFVGTTDAADLLFKAHNGTMTLLQNGNLGIGNTPNEKLDVNGNIILNYNHLYFTSDHNYGLGYEQYFTHQVPATSYYNATGLHTTAASTEQYTINSTVMAGVNGGALGSNLGTTQNVALTWFPDGGVSIGKNSHDGAAVLELGGNLEMDNHDILLRNHHHGLGVYFSGRVFNTANYEHENIDGPVLYGWDGGALGSKYFTGPVIGHNDADDLETIALHWYRDGKVQIGQQILTSASPHFSNYQLSVGGKLVAKEIFVTTNNWADYVFANDYKLSSLEQVEKYITNNKHLPDVPSEKEILENGNDLGQTEVVLLKKVEELTLYMIEQNKKIAALSTTIQAQQTQIKALENK
jgi:hypothetical protein